MYLFSGKIKREEQIYQSNPCLLPVTPLCETEKATGVAIRGHTAAVVSTQSSKPLIGMRSGSCFPSETVHYLN